jgi:hypothetical protein
LTVHTAAVTLLAFIVAAPAASGVQRSPVGATGAHIRCEASRDALVLSLALDVRSPQGDRLPIGFALVGSIAHPRWGPPLVTREIRATVGRLWAPRPELTVALDGTDTLDVDLAIERAPEESGTLQSVTARLSAEALARLAAADAVTGHALRLPYALTDGQRRAVARFTRRLESIAASSAPLRSRCD